MDSAHLITIDQLIHRVREYTIPSTTDGDGDKYDDVSDDIDGKGKLCSDVGIEEPAKNPVAAIPTPERFRPKSAAVLICIFEDDDGKFRVILTERSPNLSKHAGEVSLPGGKVEDGDKDDMETAMREAEEEIGLDSALVTVVANLEPFYSKQLQKVSPVLAVLHDKHLFKPKINASEVETIFDAPLEMFLKDENHRSEEREWMGEKYLLHYFDYKIGNKIFVIWGMTAVILIHAASIVYQKQPSFPEKRRKFQGPRYTKQNLPTG